MKKQHLILSIAFLGLSSCAMKGQSIRDVPTINSQNIQAPLRDLPKKEVTISVVDARKEEVKAQSDELRSEVRRAVAEALERQGVAVKTPGANSLLLTIEDYQTGQFKEGCVKVSGVLTIPNKAKAKAEASSCFETKHPFGFKMGTDITKAYEEALNLLFKNLDSALSEVYLR
ncbi:hypothetical protein [Bdellovibrio bacteriovorus]|uniref:hypothetical protein n=1 Tax=Bdellovibrio bacteriovorus TaxID=959 RepID=UPI003AA9A0AD